MGLLHSMRTVVRTCGYLEQLRVHGAARIQRRAAGVGEGLFLLLLTFEWDLIHCALGKKRNL